MFRSWFETVSGVSIGILQTSSTTHRISVFYLRNFDRTAEGCDKIENLFLNSALEKLFYFMSF